jgi:hypothetical protein
VAGGAITGAAQTVYSINAVGYVNLTIPAGFSMVANPLNTTNNTVAALFPTVPEFTTVYKYTTAGFVSADYAFGEWGASAQVITVNPGEGVFVFVDSTQAPAGFTNTFVGEVMQTVNAVPLQTTIPVGFSIRSSMVPQAGTADELGLTASLSPEAFVDVYKYNPTTGGYLGFNWAFGAWGTTPSFNVGEAFWINSDTAGVWTRDFTVNTP